MALLFALFASLADACSCKLAYTQDGVWACLPLTCGDLNTVNLRSANVSVLDLSNVETIAQGVSLISNYHLKTVMAPKLKSVVGGLQVQDNSAWTHLEFPVLESVSGLLSVDTSAYQEVAFPKLTSVGFMYITRNTHLQQVSFPVLGAADNMTLTTNPHLVSALYPVLAKSKQVRISGSNLQQIDLNKLSSVEKLILDDSDLRGQAAPALTATVDPFVKLDSLKTVTGSISLGVRVPKVVLHVTSVDTLLITGAIGEVTLNELASVRTITVGPTIAMAHFSAPVLKAVLVKMEIYQNQGLLSVDFATLAEVRGSIDISAGDLTSISFPLLKQVFGSVSIGNLDDLVTLNLPALSNVYQTFNLGAGSISLTHVDLTSLQSVGRLTFGSSRLYEEADDAPVTKSDIRSAAIGKLDLVLPALNNCTYLQIKNDNTLQSFTAPEWAKFTTQTGTSAYFRVQSSTLKSISIPKVETVSASMHFADMPYLTSLNFPALTYVKKILTIDLCDSLVHVSMPKIYEIDSYLKITDCYALDRVEFPTLNTVREDLTIARTPKLTYVNLRGLRTVGVYNNVGLWIRDLLGTKACVDLDCFEQIQLFDVYWCTMRNTTAPKCDQDRHWNCACP